MSTQLETAGLTTTPKVVAIFCLSALGELLLAIPLIAETRRRYPSARLLLVVERPAVVAFARDLGMADDVISLPGRSRKSVVSLAKNMSVLAALNIDIALQTFTSHGAFGNILIGATKAPVRCGFDSGKMTDKLTHLVPVVHDKHHISLNLDLLRRLGHYDVADPVGRVLPAVENSSQSFSPGSVRKDYGRYAVISAGSDPKMRFKRWDAAKWGNLCDRLSSDGIKPVFIGHISEKEEIDGILSKSDGNGVNLAGSTGLSDLAALLQECAVVIGTDGMLLHLAAAMAKPCVGIFGPTHADNVGPWGQSERVVSLSLPCSPCYGLDTTGKGIRCTTHECLRHLPVEMVYQKVRSTIDETERDSVTAGEDLLPLLA